MNIMISGYFMPFVDICEIGAAMEISGETGLKVDCLVLKTEKANNTYKQKESQQVSFQEFDTKAAVDDEFRPAAVFASLADELGF